MCGGRRGHNSFDDPPELGHDMVRARGDALAAMHRSDMREEVDGLERELDELIDLYEELKFEGNRRAMRATAAEIEDIRQLVADLESGRIRATVPGWDPADARADKVGEENPIRWVRREEKKAAEWKRQRRIATARPR